MSSRRPFKIEIFVAEGLPDGLRLVKKSNWIGQGIVCARGGRQGSARPRLIQADPLRLSPHPDSRACGSLR